jgi:anthranilate phosphoribosyltransferase
VHGSDGLGELTVTGPSTVFKVEHGAVSCIELSPRDFGLDIHAEEGIRGGNVECNREIAQAILDGEPGPPREIVLMNAALALVAASGVPDFREAVDRARESIDSGAARAKLSQLRELVRQ